MVFDHFGIRLNTQTTSVKHIYIYRFCNRHIGYFETVRYAFADHNLNKNIYTAVMLWNNYRNCSK